MPLDWQSLFFSPPPKQKKGISVFTEEELDELARREQQKLPEWKQKVAGLGEAAFDYTAGLLGLPGAPQTKSYGAGELTQAGLPFLALGKKLKLPEINKKPVLYRGDPGGHEYINPQYFNRSDTLGYMTHAAEDLDYATRGYAYKHGSPMPAGQTDTFQLRRSARPNVAPVTSTAQNAVDITQLPNEEDTEKLIKGLEWWNPDKSARAKLGDERLTRARADQLIGEIPHHAQRQKDIEKKLREGIPLTQADIWSKENVRAAMKDIRIPFNDPDITDKLGLTHLDMTMLVKLHGHFQM